MNIEKMKYNMIVKEDATNFVGVVKQAIPQPGSDTKFLVQVQPYANPDADRVDFKASQLSEINFQDISMIRLGGDSEALVSAKQSFFHGRQ